MLREINFDGLVGPTHNYAGLSRGNLASARHSGWTSSPRAAALQGLEKMRFIAGLGVRQAVLPPQPRPDVHTLRRLGFSGSDADVIQRAATLAPEWLLRCASASAMWTANAATIIPSADSSDGRVHLIPANLAQMFHRQIEASTTRRVLGAIFSNSALFEVHKPLPASPLLGDEGAANHTRLSTVDATGDHTVHLFAWGRSDRPAEGAALRPALHPARQTLEASLAVARLGKLKPELLLTAQQSPKGIDAGAFHTDVLAVGTAGFLMLHEHAFTHHTSLLEGLRARLGESFAVCLATDAELPLTDAVASYPFNSQLVSLVNDQGATELVVVAPLEAQENTAAARYLSRVVAENNPVCRVEYQDVRQSMANGGGPACLRLRVQLTDQEIAQLGARVLLDDALLVDLGRWITTHYRDRLTQDDLRDPALHDESKRALDELTELLALGSVYNFQRTPS